ncbi:ankyrin repeat-containing domain protein [Pilobolus umbonatus]|nr:ankyrin repeat-containing domain protein [Pilobolus umbonatus]
MKEDTLGLHGAAKNGNVGLVKFALDHGAAIDSVVNGYLPLQLACMNDNHIAVVQYLIDRGADVNAQRWSKKHSADKSQAVPGAIGSTALHMACAHGCIKIVDLLLRNGAKIHVKDKYGSKAVDLASAKNHVEIVKLLETFGSMQQMLKGLQEGTDHVAEYESVKNSRFRRPSLPSVLEQKPDIPHISTMPPRHSMSTIRPNVDEFMLPRQRLYSYQSPELTSSKSSDESDEAVDWYSYGVVNHYEDENYLVSLERRAYGMRRPSEEEPKIRYSLDSNRPRPDTPLKRCSSDGGHLRTTALMNSMAANKTDEEEPRQSLYDERPNIEALDKVKKSWWGRKSMDSHRPSVENSRRSSLDMRPNLESLSHLAKKSMEGLSRKSIDMEFNTTDEDRKNNISKSFLSRWWTSSSTK